MNDIQKQDSIRIIDGKPYRTGFLKAGLVDPLSLDLRAARRENVLGIEEHVFHYTSLEGFLGIVKSGGFWASDNRFMNDSREMNDGVGFAVRALDHCSERSRLPAFKSILQAVRVMLLTPPSAGNLVVCFSTTRDSLEQWRGYGPSGGVCVCLEGNVSGPSPLFFFPDHAPFKTLYKPRAKAVMLLSIIRSFEREYILDSKTMSEWPDEYDNHYVDNLTSALIFRMPVFKDISFQQEAEIRLIIPYNSVGHYAGGLKFRVGPMGLVPYICTGDHKSVSVRLPMREVIIGPSYRQQLIAEGVRIFLDQNDYHEVAVTLSKVPYRS